MIFEKKKLENSGDDGFVNYKSNESQPIVLKEEDDEVINGTTPSRVVLVGSIYHKYGSTDSEGGGTGNNDNHEIITQSASESSSNRMEDVRPPIYVYIVAACAALNSCNLGFDVGVNSPAGILVQEHLRLSDTNLEVFMGSINFFSLGGALLSSKIVQYFGMLKSFVISSIVFLLGILVIVVSDSFRVIMIGRVLVGLGVGFGFTITPMYLAEISPKSHRGAFVSWSEIGCNIGILIGFLTAFWFNQYPVNVSWRYMFAMGGILPLVVALLAGSSTLFNNNNDKSLPNNAIGRRMPMVESPRWLVTQGKHSEALLILRQLHPFGYDVQQVLMDIQEDIIDNNSEKRQHMNNVNQQKISNVEWSYLLYNPPPTVKRMLLIGLGIALIHEGTGIDAIQYYLVFIMEASGITSRTKQAKYLVSLGALKLCCLFISCSLVDKLGRRPLMFLSLSGMSIALFFIASEFFFLQQHEKAAMMMDDDDDDMVLVSNKLILIGLALYLSSFSLGLGPLGWILPPELFSTTIRSKAVACTTFMNRITATIVTSSMLSIADTITWGGYFCLFGFLCFCGILFCYHYLPETKGKTLEEMTLYFANLTNDTDTLSSLGVLLPTNSSSNNNNNNSSHNNNKTALE